MSQIESARNYLVVLFKSGVQVISSTWMINENYCWSPKNPKDLVGSYDNAVKNHTTPTKRWAKYKIQKVFGTFDSFLIAKAKEQVALQRSDLDTDAEPFDDDAANLSREIDDDSASTDSSKRSSSSSGCESGRINAKKSKTQKASKSALKSVENTRKVTGNLEKEKKRLDKSTITKADQTKERPSTVRAPLNIEEDKLEDLRTTSDRNSLLLERCLSYLQKIDRKMSDLTIPQGGAFDENMREWRNRLPLTTTEQVDEVETILLSSEEKKKHLIDFLRKAGGTTVDDTIRRVLKEIFTNDLATHYSWKGRRGKRNLSVMVLTETMYTAVELVAEMTKQKFENRLKEWFRHATARLLAEAPVPRGNVGTVQTIGINAIADENVAEH